MCLWWFPATDPIHSLSTKALKESFIKAIGTGLGFNLQRVEFHLPSEPLTEGRVLRQTKMHLDEEEEEDWIFEVSLFGNRCKLRIQILLKAQCSLTLKTDYRWMQVFGNYILVRACTNPKVKEQHVCCGGSLQRILLMISCQI